MASQDHETTQKEFMQQNQLRKSRIIRQNTIDFDKNDKQNLQLQGEVRGGNSLNIVIDTRNMKSSVTPINNSTHQQQNFIIDKSPIAANGQYMNIPSFQQEIVSNRSRIGGGGQFLGNDFKMNFALNQITQGMTSVADIGKPPKPNTARDRQSRRPSTKSQMNDGPLSLNKDFKQNYSALQDKAPIYIQERSDSTSFNQELDLEEINIIKQITNKAYDLSLKYNFEEQSLIQTEREKLSNLLKEERLSNENTIKKIHQEQVRLDRYLTNNSSPNRRSIKRNSNSSSYRDGDQFERSTKLYEDYQIIQNKIQHKRQESLHKTENETLREHPSICEASKQMAQSIEPLYLRQNKILQKKQEKIQQQIMQKQELEQSQSFQQTQNLFNKTRLSQQELNSFLQSKQSWEQSRNLKREQKKQQIMTQQQKELTFKPKLNSKSKSINLSFQDRLNLVESSKHRRMESQRKQYDKQLTFKPMINNQSKHNSNFISNTAQKANKDVSQQKIQQKEVKQTGNPLKQQANKKVTVVCDLNQKLNNDIFSIVNKYMTNKTHSTQFSTNETKKRFQT